MKTFLNMDNDRRNLILLLLIGIVIRLWGIDYGLPSVYNSTEYFIAKHALSFGARHTAEPLYFIYPTFYTYLIAALFAGYYLAGLALGMFSSSADFALLFLTDPTAFYLLGRLLNAAAMLAALLVFYRGIRYLLPSGRAFGVSLLFLFSINLQAFTFWMVPDAFLILGTVFILYFMARGIRRPLRGTDTTAAALLCGFTISTKYNAGFLAFGWLVYLYLFGSGSVVDRIRRLIPSAILIFVGFIIGSPYWLLTPGKFLEGFRTILSQSANAYNLETGLPYLWELKTIISSEWLAGLLLVVLFISFAWRPNRLSVALMSAALPTFLLVGSWQKKGLDYLLIVFPILFFQLAILLDRFQTKPATRYLKPVLLILLLFSVPRILHTNYLHTRTDTRTMAGAWVRGHLPPGSVICYDHYHYDIDLIDVERYVSSGRGSRLLSPNIRRKLEGLRLSGRNYRFFPAQKEIPVNALPANLSADPFLREILSHPHQTLQEIIDGGAQLLILNEETYRKFLDNPTPPPDNPLRTDFLTRQAFSRYVLEQLNPVAEFRPGWKTPGPVIRIYDLRGTTP